MNPSQILTVEAFLSDLGDLIAAQEDLTPVQIIGALEIIKAELLKIIKADKFLALKIIKADKFLANVKTGR